MGDDSMEQAHPRGGTHLSLAPPATGQCWVGRTHEMAILEAALAASCHGQGHLVLLEGAPGIGKTRMLQELAASVGAQAMQILWGRCYEGEGAPPFWPWIQMFRSYVRSRTPDTLQAELGGGAAVLAPVSPGPDGSAPEAAEAAADAAPADAAPEDSAS